ncbi:unnamed protein product [Clonostachys rhizophaga]|uniref:Uncharacterized protein n=1 Tax=Clonostachys rhizophaga TaxID=160324 RepID=A0A9N9VS19_9HYPO|nr:unnamed protein product [Clonostachys rhizophaga]
MRIQYDTAEYRVGVPSLRPLPLLTSQHNIENRANLSDREQLYNEVADMLNIFGIELPNEREFKQVTTDPRAIIVNDGYPDRPIALVYRYYKYAPQEPRFTLLITAYWSSSSDKDWVRAVQAIKVLKINYLRGQDVDVEMIATNLFRRLATEPDLDRPVCEEDIVDICEDFGKLWYGDPATKKIWYMPPHWGWNGCQHIEDNTFLVHCHDSFKEADWPLAAGKLRRILEPYGYHLRFEHRDYTRAIEYPW